VLAVALRASTAPSAMCRATWLDPLEWSAMQDPRAAPALAASASLSEARVNRGVYKCRASYHVPFVSYLATCRCHSCTRRAERTGHPDPSLISTNTRMHFCCCSLAFCPLQVGAHVCESLDDGPAFESINVGSEYLDRALLIRSRQEWCSFVLLCVADEDNQGLFTGTPTAARRP